MTVATSTRSRIKLVTSKPRGRDNGETYVQFNTLITELYGVSLQ